MKSKIIIIPVVLLLFFFWFDYSYKQAMDNSWHKRYLDEELHHVRVDGIIRRKDNNKVYCLEYLRISGYFCCFDFDKDFDSYIKVGDFITKDSGELILKVEKTNEYKSFHFTPRYCDTPYVEMVDKLYSEK